MGPQYPIAEKTPAEVMRVLESVARRSGYSSLTNYLVQFIKHQGFGSILHLQGELFVHLTAKERYKEWSDDEWLRFMSKLRPSGSASLRTYKAALKKESMASRRAHKRLLKKELAQLITERLIALEKNQSWLAKEIGITRECVRQYVSGSAYPKAERLMRLMDVLEVNKRLNKK